VEWGPQCGPHSLRTDRGRRDAVSWRGEAEDNNLRWGLENLSAARHFAGVRLQDRLLK